MVQALLELYPFKTLYIADLDAISGHGDHQSVIFALRTRYPQLEIWLDPGIKQPEQLALWNGLELNLIIGSEGLVSRRQYELLVEALEPRRTLLSLDFKREGYIGAVEVLGNAALWPQRLIAMTLQHVGSGQGPDLKLLQELILRAGHGRVYAAGGIRDRRDLEQLKQIGVAGALIASALHDGQITAPDLLT